MTKIETKKQVDVNRIFVHLLMDAYEEAILLNIFLSSFSSLFSSLLFASEILFIEQLGILAF